MDQGLHLRRFLLMAAKSHGDHFHSRDNCTHSCRHGETVGMWRKRESFYVHGGKIICATAGLSCDRQYMLLLSAEGLTYAGDLKYLAVAAPQSPGNPSCSLAAPPSHRVSKVSLSYG